MLPVVSGVNTMFSLQIQKPLIEPTRTRTKHWFLQLQECDMELTLTNSGTSQISNKKGTKWVPVLPGIIVNQ